MNPYEYCMKAAGINMTALDHQNSEYKIIYDYAMNTLLDQDKKTIKNILKLTKPNEDFTKDYDNRVLLFHGSRLSNFLGIVS